MKYNEPERCHARRKIPLLSKGNSLIPRDTRLTCGFVLCLAVISPTVLRAKYDTSHANLTSSSLFPSLCIVRTILSIVGCTVGEFGCISCEEWECKFGSEVNPDAGNCLTEGTGYSDNDGPPWFDGRALSLADGVCDDAKCCQSECH